MLKNILAMTIFGTIGLVVRKLSLSSEVIAFYRGGIGTIFLLFVLFLKKESFSIENLIKNRLSLLISGIALGINWVLLFQSYKYTTISNATLSYYLAPIFIIIISCIMLKEKITKFNILSIFLALFGMLLIVGIDIDSSIDNYIGIGYGVIAAIFYAIVVISNKFLKDISNMEITITQLFISVLVMSLTIFLEGKNIYVNSYEIVYVLIIGIIHTGIAYLLYFSSLSQLKGQSIAILSYIDPVIALIISAIFLGENLSILQFFGGVLILSSSLINEIFNKKFDKN